MNLKWVNGMRIIIRFSMDSAANGDMVAGIWCGRSSECKAQ